MKKQNFLNVCMLQCSIIWENQEKNYGKVLSLLSKKPPQKGSMICLPELFSTGYTMQAEKFAEDADNSLTLTFLKGVAEFYECFVMGSLILKSKTAQKPANTVVVFSPGGHMIYQYDKIHLLPLSGEPQSYKSGRSIKTFSINGRTFASLICFDLRFPELFRILYNQNITGVFIPANWPAARASHWNILLKARAVENQMYIFGINRTGKDPHHAYKGGSSVISPSGRILAHSDKQKLMTCKIDLDAPEKIRKQFPFKASRAVSVYKKYKPYL